LQPFGTKKKEIKNDLRLICWNVWFQNQGIAAKISEEIAQICIQCFVLTGKK